MGFLAKSGNPESNSRWVRGEGGGGRNLLTLRQPSPLHAQNNGPITHPSLPPPPPPLQDNVRWTVSLQLIFVRGRLGPHTSAGSHWAAPGRTVRTHGRMPRRWFHMPHLFAWLAPARMVLTFSHGSHLVV